MFDNRSKYGQNAGPQWIKIPISFRFLVNSRLVVAAGATAPGRQTELGSGTAILTPDAFYHLIDKRIKVMNSQANQV
ncbi:hypothetical protein N9003_01315 [bacterium]|jgi:hypothetical protein|nr:hypothetical protein [bacterium]